ncbi:MAG: rhodanese-like domain-containing protein [Flavipsychrobacter sp.]|nr:rhodanese-like domain-containing protein [Flavipsychrobacter sp.]
MHQISPKELKEKLDSNADVLLIDIREDWERELFHIGGLHIPMGEIPAHLPEIPKDREVVLYCEKGIRSTITIQRLESAGYQNLINLSGGMKAWKELSE